MVKLLGTLIVYGVPWAAGVWGLASLLIIIASVVLPTMPDAMDGAMVGALAGLLVWFAVQRLREWLG